MPISTKPTTTPIVYDGKISELYKIFLLNLFLGIITLGLYHFWGKTRTRRYLTSSFAISNDRFEYTGYGSELFWGFIKTIIFLTVISIPFFWSLYDVDKISQKFDRITAQTDKSSSENQQADKAKLSSQEFKAVFKKLSFADQQLTIVSVLIIFGYLIFYYMYLPFVAVFTSLRYRSTRTRLRGIRGKMHGLGIFYGLIGLFHTILKIITIGLWIPFADAMTFGYKMRRLFFGTQRGIFKAAYGKLLGYHIFTLLFSGILLLIPFGLIYIFNEELVTEFPQQTHVLSHFSPLKSLQAEPLTFQAIIYSFIFLSFLLCYIPRYWYKAALVRVQYNGLQFSTIGFHCTMSGWGLFKLQIINAILFMCTLGLASPLITHRRMKFFCRHVHVLGNTEQSHISQATGKKDKTGEGLSTLFDLDLGLF